VSLHTEGPAPYAAPELSRSFRVNALFVGPNVRRAVQEGRADYLPVFLSEVPKLFRSGSCRSTSRSCRSRPRTARVLLPGVSVDVTRAAVQTAGTVVAQVNRRMPRTHGDGLIHEDDIDLAVLADEPIPELPDPEVTDADLAIAQHCAELVEDGATLQLGIGSIPDATLEALSTIGGSASTPRCSRRAWWTSSRRASSPAR